MVIFSSKMEKKLETLQRLEKEEKKRIEERKRWVWEAEVILETIREKIRAIELEMEETSAGESEEG